MIAKLQHPVAFTTASLFLSIAVGIGACWQTLSTAVTHVSGAAVEQPKNELKQKGWDFWTIEIENLATELKDEKARLKKQAEILEQRSARLSAEEKEFGKVRADVEALRKQISDRLIEVTADETKNVKTLAATYTNLSPRAASAILREMDETTAVKILSVMKSDVVAPIFEEMSRNAAADPALAKRAATLSEKLRLMKAPKPATTS